MKTDVNASQIRIIRFALLGGIVALGVVAAVIAAGEPEGLTLNRPGPLVGVVALMIVLAAGGVMYLRRQLEMTLEMAKRARLLIIGHALCEAAALLGAIHLLLTGGLLPYLAGLVVFGFSMILLPIQHGG